jgi:hypothetical protein
MDQIRKEEVHMADLSPPDHNGPPVI